MGNQTSQGFERIAILYATETGTAQRLAQEAMRVLEKGALPVTLSSLEGFEVPADDKTLHLFVVSSTGDGDLAGMGEEFLDRIAKDAPLIDKAGTFNYAIMALGDRAYSNFCGGADALEDELGESLADAKALIPTAKASQTDNENFPVFKKWLEDVHKALGIKVEGEIDNVLNDKSFRAKLIGKERLDKPESCCNIREVWRLTFKVRQKIPFRAGDLFMVTPPGDTKPRFYSLASFEEDRSNMEIIVGYNPSLHKDGVASSSHHLTQELALDESIEAKWRSHASFNLPDDGGSTPVIMVAAGTGMAPMVGFMKKIAKTPRKSWLFFGNANCCGDDYLRDEWEKALADGVITAIDWVFDDEKAGYVQGAMVEKGAQIIEWLEKEGAIIYVCGRKVTVGKGVEDALEKIYVGHGGLTPEAAKEKREKLILDGKVRLDLFG